jgi:hypothetical protein
MRKVLLLSLTLLAGCGGNYSNEDLAFLYALPSAEALSATVPGQATAQQGLGVRQDALALGDLSEAHRITQGAIGEFNGGLEHLLGWLQAVRQRPPTTREPDRRIWGPFNERRTAEHEGRLVIERVLAEVERFDWRFEIRRRGTGEDGWVILVDGAFLPTLDLRRGLGQASLWVGRARALGAPPPRLEQVDRLDISYATEGYPVQVQLTFLPVTGAQLVAGGYEYLGHEDRSGQMRFAVEANLIAGSPELLERLEITSRWTASGAGQADTEVVSGNGQGARQTECWDANRGVVYFARTWEPGQELGSPGACAL